MDDRGAFHSVQSVEVYIPWNNTWLDLPALPDLSDEGGRMDLTRILSLTDSAGSFLYLLGGSSNNWDSGECRETGTVWRLEWDRGSCTYSWRDGPGLGRQLGFPLPTLALICTFTDTIFGAGLGCTMAVGVPDSLLGP